MADPITRDEVFGDRCAYLCEGVCLCVRPAKHDGRHRCEHDPVPSDDTPEVR